MDYSLIKKKIAVKKTTIKKVAEAIGMTEQGLHKAFTNDTLTVKMLEAIAAVLEVHIIEFFPGQAYTAIAAEPNTEYKTELEKTRDEINWLKTEAERLSKKIDGKK